MGGPSGLGCSRAGSVAAPRGSRAHALFCSPHGQLCPGRGVQTSRAPESAVDPLWPCPEKLWSPEGGTPGRGHIQEGVQVKLLRREWRHQWCRQHPASRKAWRQSERDRWAAVGLAGAGAWHRGPAAQAGALGGGAGGGRGASQQRRRDRASGGQALHTGIGMPAERGEGPGEAGVGGRPSPHRPFLLPLSVLGGGLRPAPALPPTSFPHLPCRPRERRPCRPPAPVLPSHALLSRPPPGAALPSLPGATGRTRSPAHRGAQFRSPCEVEM